MKYSDVVYMIEALHSFATDIDPYELGLQNWGEHMEEMVKIVVSKLNIELDEDPRIQSIIEYTGCSREQAIKLIESGIL